MDFKKKKMGNKNGSGGNRWDNDRQQQKILNQKKRRKQKMRTKLWRLLYSFRINFCYFAKKNKKKNNALQMKTMENQMYIKS